MMMLKKWRLGGGVDPRAYQKEGDRPTPIERHSDFSLAMWLESEDSSAQEAACAEWRKRNPSRKKTWARRAWRRVKELGSLHTGVK